VKYELIAFDNSVPKKNNELGSGNNPDNFSFTRICSGDEFQTLEKPYVIIAMRDFISPQVELLQNLGGFTNHDTHFE
jgi:hypothetical protein